MFYIDEVLYMVTIQPLKQQYLTALKERQQIINKLNEIITGLNGIDFGDLTNIHTELITIRESIEQIESAIESVDNRLTSANIEITDIEAHLNEFEQETEDVLQSKVNKSGDTMTGNLSIPLTSTGTRDSYAVNGGRVQNDLDNYAFMVRTSGNQIIAGVKTFTNNPIIKSSDSQITMVGNNAVEEGVVSNDLAIRSCDPNGKVYAGVYTYLSGTSGSVHSIRSLAYNTDAELVATATLNVVASRDGSTYATSPTPLANATSNEIATAEWVISKINEFATANNLQVIQ